MADMIKYLDEEIKKLEGWLQGYPDLLEQTRKKIERPHPDIVKMKNVGVDTKDSVPQAEKELSYEYERNVKRLEYLKQIQQNIANQKNPGVSWYKGQQGYRK